MKSSWSRVITTTDNLLITNPNSYVYQVPKASIGMLCYAFTMVFDLSLPQLYPLNSFVDARGRLTSVEFPQKEMTRFYFIQALKAHERRGYHAHKNLTQIFIPIVGNWSITISKQGYDQEFSIFAGENYLYLPPGFWREFESHEDAGILGVLADDIYREEDYIRSYEEFFKPEALD
jgi:hypothetical protein